MCDLRQKLGSLIISGFDGSSLPANFQTLFEQQSLGGIILFARNYDISAKLKRLTTAVQSLSNGTAIVAVDQEGGRVVRFSGDFPVFPSPRHFGVRNDVEGYLYGTEVTAKALYDHGVNLNLVPVCDLDPGDSSHVLHSRAYSGDVEAVANCVEKQIEALRVCKVMSCAKHFPGLRSAAGDPHLRVAHSAQTLKEFRERDYLPFQAAITAGVDMVMPTHLRADALDDVNTVTFSRKVLGNELRAFLGFRGLIISDDLQMLGALEGISQIEAGQRALLAGCDLLIYANLQESINELLDKLAAAANLDEVLHGRILESYQRIVAFQNKNPQYFQT